MKLKSRVQQLEAAAVARRPAVLFMADAENGLVRTSASPDTLTPEEAKAVKESSGAKVILHITYPPPDPTPEVTFEELMAENARVFAENSGAAEVSPVDGPDAAPAAATAEAEVDPVKARELVMEALRRAVSGRDISDLDVDGVYRSPTDTGT